MIKDIRYKKSTALFCVLAFAALTSSIVWASFEKNVFLGLDVILAEKWGIATLVDIYISFTLLGIVMGTQKKSWTKGIVLTFLTYLLGSLVPLSYVLWKLKNNKDYERSLT